MDGREDETTNITTPNMKTKTQTLESLIKDCKFDYVNENIVKLFKTEPVRSKIEVRNFGKWMKAEEVIAELKKDGCVPANATELYTWYLENRDTWFKDKSSYGGVFALGSVASFGGYQHVPLTWWSDAKREADLPWFGKAFSGHDWFAFSRESSELKPSELSAPSSFELPPVLEINGIKYARQ